VHERFRLSRERVEALKPDQRASREAAILAAARELLATNSFDAITLDELVEQVGISKPTFYEHFTSKDALGVRLSRDSIEEACDQLARLEASGSVEVALKSIIDWTLEQHFGGGPHGFMRLPSRVENGALRLAERRWLAALERLIARAQKSGCIGSRAHAHVIASAFRSILKDQAFDRELAGGTLTLPALKQSVLTLLLG
jgi:AcrR family transcriptional regulator